MATRKCRNIYFPKYLMAVRKFTNICIPKYFRTSVSTVVITAVQLVTAAVYICWFLCLLFLTC